MHKYKRLLAPYSFDFLELRNRMVMGAMHTRIEVLDQPLQRLAAFFRERARGEIGLILTGGFAPNQAGRMEEDAPVLESREHLETHRVITKAVHAEGGRIALQILHAGRYGKHSLCVGPTSQRASINRYTPHMLAIEEVWDTVKAIANTAKLAQEAGYDGVEIMGSEGYLLNEFVSPRTNTRVDIFGGNFENRIRLPIETIKAVRSVTGPNFLLIYRISAIDLVEDGLTGIETAQLARRVQVAGANMLNTGIGWHESTIPTIAASVPRAAWLFAIKNIKQAVTIPVIASNRINSPDVGERLLADGAADFVSMARPLLADPEFPRKTREDRADQINSCIACNQVCLDYIFTDKTASCLVNPRAGRELDFPPAKALSPKCIAVVGGGAAGMAFAVYAAERGHDITLFEAKGTLGGQLNLACRIPGKSEFKEMLRYFRVRLDELGVHIKMGKRVIPSDLRNAGFDTVVITTGVIPRIPAIDGIDHAKVARYDDVLSGRQHIGHAVAIIGAGGIAFDTAEFLLADPEESLSPQRFQQTWGIDPSLNSSGGLDTPARHTPLRRIHMLQRKKEKPGASLGKSTGWILKTRLRRAGVTMIAGVHYHKIDDAGLEYSYDGQTHVLPVDNVIICAGQISLDDFSQTLAGSGMQVATIGGARLASELDAARAIREALQLAVSL